MRTPIRRVCVSLRRRCEGDAGQRRMVKLGISSTSKGALCPSQACSREGQGALLHLRNSQGSTQPSDKVSCGARRIRVQFSVNLYSFHFS